MIASPYLISVAMALAVSYPDSRKMEKTRVSTTRCESTRTRREVVIEPVQRASLTVGVDEDAVSALEILPVSFGIGKVTLDELNAQVSEVDSGH
jgi:hypothetical protein